ncbi:MAG: hypothetical protein ABGW78_03565 [Pirellulales bacterium]
MIQRVARPFLFLCLTALFSGCSDSGIVPVSGTVLMDAEPLLLEGFIRVEPTDGRAATGKINPQDGSFSLTTFSQNDGCMPGTHAVSVIVNKTIGMNTVSMVPEKYLSSETSELTVTIDGPTDALSIQLTGGITDIPENAPSPPDEGDLYLK